MSAYIRVELHQRTTYDKPTSDDYAKLHALLAEKKILRSVTIESIGEQCLPSGLYFTQASDKREIGKDVNWAARQVRYPYSYVVVINGGALVRNLEACSCD
jgi:hypothetical protein